VRCWTWCGGGSRDAEGARLSRDKGARREHQVADLHKSTSIHAERVSLPGASRYQGNGADVDVYALRKDAAPMVAEVRARANALLLIRDRADIKLHPAKKSPPRRKYAASVGNTAATPDRKSRIDASLAAPRRGEPLWPVASKYRCTLPER
jgi:hypothetical protein